ncbi:restriction endonuclease subunit S [Lacticaseibacillus rhamnosus]|nr:restriction endonuclease subunit S [Lacticaseibacillus rhamnosus]
MSKDKKRLVPVRRFKEFENAPAWEQRKLGDVVNRFDNLRIPVTASKRIHGEFPYYGANGIQDYVDGYTHNGEYILVAEDGASNVYDYPVNYVKGKVWVNNHAHVIQGKTNIADNLFLLNAIKSINIASFLVGGSRAKLNAEIMMELPIKIPSYNEQKKIGKYFANIDSLITLHQRKLDKLKRVKSAYLTEMFPAEGEREPKRRFPGFTVAWEQRKFFDNIEKVIDFRGRTPKKLGMEWSAEGYTALSALNVKDGYIDFTADVHYANQDLYDKWMAGNELYKGQVLFTTEAPMGNVAQVPDNRKYVLSQRTIAFNVDKTKVTNDFLAVLLRSQNVQHTLKSLASGGTAQGVSQKSLSQLKVILPINPKEQQEIGNFFNHFDTLITLHQRKLDKLKKMKAAYLEEMFV